MAVSLPSILRRFCRSQSGAVAIEFALIAPLLFALLLGIVTLGYFMGVSHSVNQLATGAARASVAGLDPDERKALANAYFDTAHTRYPLLSKDAIAQVITYEDRSTSGSEDTISGINIVVSYDLDGSILDVANSFLGLELTEIERSAYVTY